MFPILGNCLMYLQSLDKEAHLDVLKDNIMSAVGKIYAAGGSDIIPASELLTRILANTPLKGDDEEMGPISVLLTKMTAKNPELIMANLEGVLKIMIDTVLNADKYKLKEKNAMILKDYLLKITQDSNSAQIFQNIVNSLDNTNKDLLNGFLTMNL